MPLSGKEFVKLLKRNGWSLSRVVESHHIMEKGKKTISIPVHGNKSLGKGLESKLLKITGIKKK